ncbi:MAG: hypothetical protein Q8K75_08100 [Chlamydiales bacterium]|nr:hypothetical protein [Chlamydiales bacterium]
MNHTIQTFQQLYHKSAECLGWPSLKLRHIRHSVGADGYLATCRGGELEITAGTPLGLSYGLAQNTTALRSGYREEFLGPRTPHFSLRPLFLSGAESFDPARIIELGYNCVIVESDQTPIPENLDGLLLGRKVCVSHPIRKPMDAGYRKALEHEVEAKASSHILFYESQLLHPSFESERATTLDLVSAELALVESLMPKTTQLIFYVPALLAEWLPALCDVAGDRTKIAFSNKAAIWEVLRKQKDPSVTPLMPLLRMSMGRGLWPSLPLARIDRTIGRMFGSNFAGMIVCVSHVPIGDGPLAASLWIAGQAQWQRQSATYLAEAWFAAYRPDLKYSDHSSLFSSAEMVDTELTRLTDADVYPAGRIEIALANLRHIDYWLQTHENSHTPMSSLGDYFRYFVRDAWCLLYYHIDRLRISVQGAPMALDHHGGFWAALNTGGGSRCIPTAATVKPLDIARVIPEEPRMSLIFQEN